MFYGLKTLDLNALPPDVREVVLAVGEQASVLTQQNAALTESNTTLATQNAELEALNARLEHFVKELNQVIYGSRSEKLTQDTAMRFFYRLMGSDCCVGIIYRRLFLHE